MKVTQVFELVNESIKQTTGESLILNEDLSNLQLVGKEIFGDIATVDNFVHSLVDHIGRVIFVNRKYTGRAPKLLRDSWEYGSITQKIQAEPIEFSMNYSWDLTDGEDYSTVLNTFYEPKVSSKFFNGKLTLEAKQSYARKQVKSAFDNKAQMNGFLEMLTVNIENGYTLAYDSLIQQAINNFIGETVFEDFQEPTDPALVFTGGRSGNRAVNLLHLYQQEIDATLTDPKKAITTPEFIRFAVYTMNKYQYRMTGMTGMFNLGKKRRFTPLDKLHVLLLADFKFAADVYLQSDTYNTEFTKLPESHIVQFWQGLRAGENPDNQSFEFGAVSKIDITTSDTEKDIEMDGIIGVMFDHDAVGVLNDVREVENYYVPSNQFYTNFYKSETSFFNDFNEQFVVFYVK